MKKICYYPELTKITGSVTATLMMSQLEFWFKTTGGKSFFKFLEPCAHERYKEGDSWQEELGMSTSEIRYAFKRIGEPYKSKSAFMKSEDVFKGKLYASYYDRIRKVTYYFRNTQKVKEIFEILESEAACVQEVCVNKEDEVREENRETFPTRETEKVNVCNLSGISSENEDLADGLFIQDNKQDNHLRQQREESYTGVDTHIPYVEICEVYNEELGNYLGIRQALNSYEKELIKHLWLKLGKRLEDFRLGFKKVSESSFLCGRLEGKNFRASLAWILKLDHFRRILAGEFDDFKSTTKLQIQKFNEMASHDNWDFDEIERLERGYIDQKLAAYGWS